MGDPFKLARIAFKIAAETIDSHMSITNGLVFVYGTLREGENGHQKLCDSVHLGPINTASMYELHLIPELGDDAYGMGFGDQCVSGELYQVSQDKLKELDMWEEGYTRTIIQLEDGRYADAYFRG